MGTHDILYGLMRWTSFGHSVKGRQIILIILTTDFNTDTVLCWCFTTRVLNASIKYFEIYMVCPGKSIRISLSDCKLCEQNNTTVKLNYP